MSRRVSGPFQENSGGAQGVTWVLQMIGISGVLRRVSGEHQKDPRGLQGISEALNFMGFQGPAE